MTELIQTLTLPNKQFHLIMQGDVLAMFACLPDESVDCVMTSPPYWGLRDYKLPPKRKMPIAQRLGVMTGILVMAYFVTQYLQQQASQAGFGQPTLFYFTLAIFVGFGLLSLLLIRGEDEVI